MRVSDPIGGSPDFARLFRDYEEHFRDIDHYSYELRHLIARYSRGDEVSELRGDFGRVVEKVRQTDADSLQSFPQSDHIFVHRGRFLDAFHDALVILSIGLCLRAPREQIADVRALCEPGDPLQEAIAGAALDVKLPRGAPAFYDTFDRLYDALQCEGRDRERCIADYLAVWYRDKMEGLSMKDKHLVEDRPQYVGYWCFEAAGMVAALDIDDRSFASHPHYPRDLVAFYRSRKGT